MPKRGEWLIMGLTIIFIPIIATAIGAGLLGIADWFHAYWEWAGSSSGG